MYGLGPRARFFLGAVLAGLSVAASGATPAQAATTRTTTFAGKIGAGTGRYAHARGAVRLVLRGTTSTDGLTRTFTLAIGAPACAGQAVAAPGRCVRLSGTVRGAATTMRVVPDVGMTFNLLGSGTVAPLGRVALSGAAHGTGFIATGRIGLRVTLRTPAGSVTVSAQSGKVRGFTSPF